MTQRTDISSEMAEMAYNAAVDTLKSQDTTLGNLRTRASGLLATGALAVTFSSSVGLFSTDAAKGVLLPEPYVVVMGAVFAALGLCCLYIAWPIRRFAFGPDPCEILSRTLDRNPGKPALQWELAQELASATLENETPLKYRYYAYQAAVILLISGVIVLAFALRAASA